MKEKRILEIEILGENDREIFFKIKKQTHKNINFFPNGSNSFRASNGINLASYIFPDLQINNINNEITVCLQGANSACDDFIINAPKNLMEEIKKAVKEYNIRGNVLSRKEKRKILEKAIGIVLDLAEDNILTKEYCDGIKSLEAMRKQHISAVETVKKEFNIK